MDWIHFFLFCSGHDLADPRDRVIDRIVHDRVVILIRLRVFPFCVLQTLCHDLRRNVAPMDKAAADLLEQVVLESTGTGSDRVDGGRA